MSAKRIPGSSCLAAPKFVGGLAYVIQGVQKSCLQEPTRAFQSEAAVQAALADLKKLLNGPLRPAIVVFVQKINCDGHITFANNFAKLPKSTQSVEEGTVFFPGTVGDQNAIEYIFTPANTNHPIKMSVQQTKRALDNDEDDIAIIEELEDYVASRESSAAQSNGVHSLWYKKDEAKGAERNLRVCVPVKGNTCASAVWLTGQHKYFPHSSAVMDDSGYNPIKNGDESLFEVFNKLGISEVCLAGLAPSQHLLHTAADLARQGFKVSMLQSATPCVFPESSRDRVFECTLAEEHAIDKRSPLHHAHSPIVRVYPTWSSFNSGYANQVVFKTLPEGNVRNNDQTPDLEFKLYNVSLPTGQSTWKKLRVYAKETKEAYDDNPPQDENLPDNELQRLLAKEDRNGTRFLPKHMVICNSDPPQHMETCEAKDFRPRSKRWASVQYSSAKEGGFVSAIFCVRPDPKAFGFLLDSDEGTMQLIKEMLEFRDSVAIIMLLALLEQIEDMLKLIIGVPEPTGQTATPKTPAPQGGFMRPGTTGPDGYVPATAPTPEPGAPRATAPRTKATPVQPSLPPKDTRIRFVQNLYIALFLVYEEARSRYMNQDANGPPKTQGQCLAEIGFGWGSYTKPAGPDGRQKPGLYSNVCAYQKFYLQDKGRDMLGKLYNKHNSALKKNLGQIVLKEVTDDYLAEIVGKTFTRPLERFDEWAKSVTEASSGVKPEEGKELFGATRAREYICLDDVYVFLHAKKAHEQNHPQCVSRLLSGEVQQEFMAFTGRKVLPYVRQGATLSYVLVHPTPRYAEDLQPGMFHVIAQDTPVATQSEPSSEPSSKPTHVAVLLMPSTPGNSYYNAQHYAEKLPFSVMAVAPFYCMRDGRIVPVHSPGDPCVYVSNRA